MAPNGQFDAGATCIGNLSTHDERRLEGKVAIVTGGAAGIGEAIVRLFAQHGAKVIIADVAEKAGKRLAESLSPAAAIYLYCDVSKEEDVSAAVDLAMEKYGQLDIMCNNAGTSDSFLVKSVAEYKMEEFERVMNVNVKGVMNGMKHAARVMIPRNMGCIISMTSLSGMLGGLASYSYTASKHAIIGLTKNGAAELGKYGIRMNTVSPYGVSTALTVQQFKQGDAFSVSEEDKAAMDGFFNSAANFQGHTLKTEDIAEAALYLAGEDAKYVSGHNLVVDGGFTGVNQWLSMCR